MKQLTRIAYLLVGLLFITSSIHAQNFTFYTIKGEMSFPNNISTIEKELKDFNDVFNGHTYAFIQFNAIPNTGEQRAIKQAGIQLLEYIPNKVYLASLPISLEPNSLKDLGVRGILDIDPLFKLSEQVLDNPVPDWAWDRDDVLISLNYYDDLEFGQIAGALANEGVLVIERMDHASALIASLPARKLKEVCELNFVKYVDFVAEPGDPESEDGRHLHTANAIDGDFYGARNYNGSGVRMAINDDGYAGPHIDFKGRADQSEVANDFIGSHGDMTTGIAVGAGNLDPLMRGMATHAYVHVRQYTASMSGTLPLYQDSAVLVFSSSYSNGCNAGYTTNTQLVDEEIYNNESLMQVFSAGNSNNQDCQYGAGNQWGNITGGHKSGKNVIATANLTNTDTIVSSSSRGPATDGRIKPDIAAHGADHWSTDPDNQYSPGGGTSAAAPSIAGVFTQLNHAYKTMHSDSLAPSALIKLILLIGATDLGNDGPDFIYGWGKVNALRSVRILEEGRYFSDTISQDGNNTHSIQIPDGVKRAKIMVYWADKEGSLIASKALVNDLNCSVSDTGSTSYLPWILDHTANATTLAFPATTGIDSMNNVEAIAIDNPTAGEYTLKIEGTTIPFGPQKYYVAYEFYTDEITVIHPQGGEGLIPGVQDRIHWDAYGDAGTFNIEYTIDNGLSWSTIAPSVNGAARFQNWVVPNSPTGEAKVRISRNSSEAESQSNFSIMRRPANLAVTSVCYSTNTFTFSWDSVAGATGYDVFLLGSTHMDSIGSTSNTYYDVPADFNEIHWVSVRAKGQNGMRSLRQEAIEFDGASGCILDCASPDDAGIRELNSPPNVISSCGGASSSVVKVLLENKGSNSQTGFSVSYQLDNNSIISETYNGILLPFGTDTFSFSTALANPTFGSHSLRVWTGLTADGTPCNDTILHAFDMQAGPFSTPFVEDLEGGLFPSVQTFVTNPDESYTWEEEAGIPGPSGTPTTTVYVNNFSYNTSGEEDYYSTNSIDLSNALSAELTFDISYKPYSATWYDGLRVEISEDCGDSYTQIYFKENLDLSVGGTSSSVWTPSGPSDWRSDTVDLNAYVKGEVQIRFVNINGYGNSLYLDNINVVAVSIGIEDFSDGFTWNLFPNPAQNEITISLSQALNENLSLKIIGSDGRVQVEKSLDAGISDLSLDISGIAAGIYFVHLESGASASVKRIVVMDN